MKKIIFSSSIIGTILTGNVVKAAADVKISKVTNLDGNVEYTFDVTNNNLDSNKKTSNEILTELGKLETTSGDKSELNKQETGLANYFVSAFKDLTPGATSDFKQYDETTGFAKTKQYEILIDKIIKVKQEDIIINNKGGEAVKNGEIANFNNYNVHLFLTKDKPTEKDLLEILKTADKTNFNAIDTDKVYIESYKLHNSAKVDLNGKDFDKGKEVINAILTANKVEIVTKELKPVIKVSIENEDKLDGSKFTNKKLDEIKNYLKYLSNGRHDAANPTNYDALSNAIKAIDNDKLGTITLKIKVDVNDFANLTGDTTFDTAKTYVIKFPEGFYQANPPAHDTTDIAVKFVAKKGFKLKGLAADKTVKLTNLTVEDLIAAINNEINDLNLELNTNCTITIQDFTGNVETATTFDKGKIITITINSGDHIEEDKEKDPNQNQQQPDQKDTDKKGKGCCGSDK